jgi:dihydrolipoamide dehydrogenase
VLATGTAAAIPPVPGLREVRPWDNRDVTAVKDLPRRLLVLGGGAVGLEMAQACRRLGVDEVTVVEGSDRLLPREEPFAGAEVRAALEAEGVTVHIGTLLDRVRRDGADGPVVATLGGGEVVADEILVAVGRRPSTSDLGLDTVGLPAERFVAVDDRMRAAGVPGGWLYAIGDCNGRALLTHMGKYQGRLAADVILDRGRVDAVDRGIVPRVTLTEAEARAAGVDVRVVRTATGEVPGAYTLGNGIAGTSQLIVDGRRQMVVGATFTGPGTAELLHSATIAIAGRVPMESLWHAVPSFPTVSEVWLRLLEEYGL